MNFKRRGNRISLYRSTWVPKGPGVPHGHTCQSYIGSIQADAAALPADLAEKLSPDECAALEHRILGPARSEQQAAMRRNMQREADPTWRLDTALRLVHEAAERSQTAAVAATRTQLLKSAVDTVKTVGAVAGAAPGGPSLDPLKEALRAIRDVSEAVRQGRYGRGPEHGLRKTSIFRLWTEIQAAVDGGESSLLCALQDAGFASRRKR